MNWQEYDKQAADIEAKLTASAPHVTWEVLRTSDAKRQPLVTAVCIGSDNNPLVAPPMLFVRGSVDVNGERYSREIVVNWIDSERAPGYDWLNYVKEKFAYSIYICLLGEG